MAEKNNNEPFRSNSNGKSKTSKKLPLAVTILLFAASYKYAGPILHTKLDSLFGKNAQNGNIKNRAHDESSSKETDEYISLYYSVLSQKYAQESKGKGSLKDDNINNHANQLNPNNDAYWQGRGYDERPDNWEELVEDDYEKTKADQDNHSNQLNPNNDAYWQGRGYDERPDNWREESKE